MQKKKKKVFIFASYIFLQIVMEDNCSCPVCYNTDNLIHLVGCGHYLCIPCKQQMLDFPAMHTIICENKCVICPICREPEQIPYKTLIGHLNQRNDMIITLSYHIIDLSNQILNGRNDGFVEEEISPAESFGRVLFELDLVNRLRFQGSS
jgi:hypothetical protein